MSTLIILDTPISLEKEFKVALKNIFGFSYIKLRHLNKVFGVNTRSNYKIKDLNVTERNLISFYLPDLNITVLPINWSMLVKENLQNQP